jgi:hypothetical protein
MTMSKRLFALLAIAVAVATLVACAASSNQSATPTTPTATTVTPQVSTTPAATVDPFVGDWQADPPLDAVAIADAEAAAPKVCNQVEFHAVRDVDAKTAAVVFAGTCARVRIRVLGTASLVAEGLVWHGQGKVMLPNGTSCAAVFGDGNKAQPAGTGFVKVTYNGKVCDAPVSGTVMVRRH